MKKVRGKTPVFRRDPETHMAYWACGQCGSRVGGYTITGPGKADWDFDMDPYCQQCGRHVNWLAVDELDILPDVLRWI